jgi:hypothetical protein
MKSTIVKRSVIIAGHKTSVSVEDAFWKGLKAIAGERRPGNFIRNGPGQDSKTACNYPDFK